MVMTKKEQCSFIRKNGRRCLRQVLFNGKCYVHQDYEEENETEDIN